ncbi:InlB B-repeat-containing protein [Erysipelothrix rhusiopathiae]|uniref:InlB B-repeat-containing protein n=1 Tax=Erysipelothrix rhusiopathiae TaxID=1648 RepID=UPI002B251FB8|nr:InlB B-repeat-containing protein [Erysipelothrix rhusiopathiae]WRB93018.1 InlB B-repeat-containing protein [Erysipelothrix rhusiopathiae]
MKNLRKYILSFVLVAMFMVNVVNTNGAVKADFESNEVIESYVPKHRSPSYQVGIKPQAVNASALTYPVVFELYYEYDTGEFRYIDSITRSNETELTEYVQFKMESNVDVGMVSSHVTMKDRQSGVSFFTSTYSSNMYFVEFNTQGGTFADGSDFSEISVYYNQLITYDLEYQEPVKPGFTFDGWEMDYPGSGNMWDVENRLITFHEYLFAVWSAEPVIVDYAVSYDANGAVSGDVPSGTRVEENAAYTVLDTLPNLVNPGFTFDGWNTAQDGSGKVVQPNDSFTVTGDTVFYAQWKKDIVPAVKYSVSYDANGATQGTVPSGSTVEENTVYEILGNINNLAFDNHEFVGWNDKADGSGKHYDAKDTLTITSDKVFYAQWELEQKPIPTEPEVTEPEVTEPEVTKPEVTKPEVTKPEVTQPNIPGFEENTTPQKSQVSGIESNVQSQLPNTGVSTSKFLPSLGLGIALAGSVLMVLRKKNEK